MSQFYKFSSVNLPNYIMPQFITQYVARKLQLAPEKMEMCLVRGHNKFATTLSNSVGGIDSLLMKTDSLNYDMQIVNGEETLAMVEANSAEEYLVCSSL